MQSQDLSRVVYRVNVPVFGDQSVQWVERVESKRRFPFGFSYRREEK